MLINAWQHSVMVRKNMVSTLKNCHNSHNDAQHVWHTASKKQVNLSDLIQLFHFQLHLFPQPTYIFLLQLSSCLARLSLDFSQRGHQVGALPLHNFKLNSLQTITQ